MEHYESGKKVTWLSVGGNIALGLVKVVVGYIGQSRALIADGLHALTDLGSDFAVLLGMRYASEPPDRTHPYGHHKFATLVSLFIASSIIGFCALLVVDSLRALQAGTVNVPHWPTLVVALASIAVKEFLYYRTRSVGRKLHSQMILANAIHHRTDSATSLIAAMGIGGAILLGPGWAFLDALVGLILGAYLGREGIKLGWRSLRDLVDTAPEREVHRRAGVGKHLVLLVIQLSLAVLESGPRLAQLACRLLHKQFMQGDAMVKTGVSAGEACLALIEDGQLKLSGRADPVDAVFAFILDADTQFRPTCAALEREGMVAGRDRPLRGLNIEPVGDADRHGLLFGDVVQVRERFGLGLHDHLVQRLQAARLQRSAQRLARVVHHLHRRDLALKLLARKCPANCIFRREAMKATMVMAFSKEICHGQTDR